MEGDRILTQRLAPNPEIVPDLTLPLTSEERTRSRVRWQLADGQHVLLRLPRGTVLVDGDLLQTETADFVMKVTAKSEPVITVMGDTPMDLMRAAYHLGNRHVAIELTPHYLRLLPDPVLKQMLIQLNLSVSEEHAPFQPEKGAYHHHAD